MGLLARAYDRQLPLERAALDAAVRLAAVRPDDRLLDLATGTGGLLRALADSGARPAEAVGVDRLATVLELAAARLLTGWRLMCADACRLPFSEGRFDIVTACYLLHLLGPREQAAVLTEIARVLRPGGRVVTVTVEGRRVLSRAVLCLLPRASGLRPFDPARELAAVGLVPARARFVRSGWPSLCVLATKHAQAHIARPRSGRAARA